MTGVFRSTSSLLYAGRHVSPGFTRPCPRFPACKTPNWKRPSWTQKTIAASPSTFWRDPRSGALGVFYVAKICGVATSGTPERGSRHNACLFVGATRQCPWASTAFHGNYIIPLSYPGTLCLFSGAPRQCPWASTAFNGYYIIPLELSRHT